VAIQKINRKGKAKDALIESVDQRWHCRNRITLVFGSNDTEELETYLYKDHQLEFKTVNFHQAKSKAIEEILDNSIDEYYRGNVTEIHTYLGKDKKVVIVEDNGIGFPLNKAEKVYKEFRTGSKFRDQETDSKGFLFRTLGQNGLGAAATCLTSDSFKVTIRHYNSKKEQSFEFIDGALKTKKGRVKTYKGHSGVRVELQLSKEVYKNNVIDEDLLRKRIIDLAYNNPGLTFYFNDEKYLYKKGLFELAQRIDEESAQSIGDEQFVFETTNVKKKKVKGRIDLSLSVTISKSSEDRERIISFVNSSPTFDGGFHKDRVRRLFINAIKDKLEKVAKKQKVSIVDNDILTGMTFVLGVTMPNPRFESQTKRKLVRDGHLDKALEQFMAKNMDKFLRKNKDFLELIVERAKSRHRFQELKEASKVGKKQKRQRVEKLLDANSRKDRSECSLFICEGDSAIGGLRSARNKDIQGGIALRGKPMNVAQSSIKDVLNNQEFTNIMASIGLTIGEPAIISNLRYSRIIFLADSDVDGGHINTLLINFFYTFWPELYHEGAIQVAKAPLFEVVTDKGVQYIESTAQMEKFKAAGHKIKAIHRNKGLGEMSPEAWKYLLSREEFTRIEIEDNDDARDILHVCFGKDTLLRKELLMDEKGKSSRTTKKVASKPAVKKSSSKKTKTKSKKVVKKAPTKNAKKASKKTAKKKVAKKATKKTTSKKSTKKKTTKKGARR
jgi:DNA gyrase subunit B